MKMVTKSGVAILSGGLVRVEKKITNNGKTVANFCLATSEDRNVDQFTDCVAWSYLAEAICTYSKGDKVIVIGKGERQTWTSKKDGTEQSKVVFTASAIVDGCQSKQILEDDAFGGSEPPYESQNYQNAPSDDFQDLELNDDLPF